MSPISNASDTSTETSILTIGQLAKASGVSAKMIRYYESIELLPPAERTESNYRIYAEKDVHRLRFIHRARKLGFSLDHIRVLMALWQDQSRSSREVKRLAVEHIGELEARIAEMQSMVDLLQKLTHQCQGNDRPDCPILEELAK